MNKLFCALIALIAVCLAVSVSAYTITVADRDYDGSNWYVTYNSADKDIDVRYAAYGNTYYYPSNYYDTYYNSGYNYNNCYGYNCPTYYRYGSYPSNQYYVNYYPMPYYPTYNFGYPFGWVRTIGRANYCIGWDCSYYN